MKINQIIRQRRRELSLTQEQVAAYLGVSTPAVNKWEKGSTYPDITLLPALARLLRTDLNTLLSFQEDLSDVEIETFVDHLDQMVQEQGYQAAFQAAWDKVQEYPTCEALLYSAALYLEGALSLYPVQQPEEYQTTLETWYQRLARSDTQEIRDTAVGMLISYARNRGEFSKAEELIQTLPDSPIDKEEQLAILYQRQGKYEQAQGIWEHRILHGVTEIQTALMNKLEWALLRKRPQEAEALADLYETVTSLFCFPGWMRYNARLQIALDAQDGDACVAILSQMLPAMKEAWDPQTHPLYASADDAGGSTFLSSRLADTFCLELSTHEEYAFLRDRADFNALMETLGHRS
ncbi:MAG TPA: helix-turn-helix transcriptional regulator [Candidatus Evtepia excrementipullorum]|nr:helix-turn-helix transcriptional regulator [Candidatus Evtepia excrementipullorum]